MGRITSGIGLVSGINSSQIIDQLMSIESQPVTLLKNRVDSVGQQKQAYTDLTSQLSAMQLSSGSLRKPSFFQASTVTSSDPDTLSATLPKARRLGRINSKSRGLSPRSRRSVRDLPTPTRRRLAQGLSPSDWAAAILITKAFWAT